MYFEKHLYEEDEEDDYEDEDEEDDYGDEDDEW